MAETVEAKAPLSSLDQLDPDMGTDCAFKAGPLLCSVVVTSLYHTIAGMSDSELLVKDIRQTKSSNICWFQTLKSEDLLLFCLVVVWRHFSLFSDSLQFGDQSINQKND